MRGVDAFTRAPVPTRPIKISQRMRHGICKASWPSMLLTPSMHPIINPVCAGKSEYVQGLTVEECATLLNVDAKNKVRAGGVRRARAQGVAGVVKACCAASKDAVDKQKQLAGLHAACPNRPPCAHHTSLLLHPTPYLRS